MKCSFIQADGSQCGSNAMKGKNLCFTHNPETKERHLKAASQGGMSNYLGGTSKLPEMPLKTCSDAVALLDDTINRIRIVEIDGSMNIRVANCIGYLAGHLIKALEVADLEDRVIKLEAEIANRSKA